MLKRTNLLVLSALLSVALVLAGCSLNEQGQVVLDAPITLPSPPAESQAPAQNAGEQNAGEESEAAPEEVAEEITATVSTQSLRVRQFPTTESPIVAGLQGDATVAVVGRNADSTWLQIEVPDVNTLGWITADFVTVTGDLTSVAVADVSADPTAEPVAEAEATPEPTGESAEEVAEETSAPAIDIVETALAVDEFSMLVAMLQATNLAEGLQGEGPFTVFAPMNDSFATLPVETMDALLANPSGDLTQILLLHVVPGKVMAGDLSDGMTADTFQGEGLTIGVADGQATVNGLDVILTDIEASNGVIHVIDGVLVPSIVDLANLSAPAEEATAEATEEAAAEATPAPTEEAAEEAPEEAAEEPAQEPTAAADTSSATLFPATSDLGLVATRSLRVRSQPNTEGEVLWGVRDGEYYPVLERSEDGLWLGLAVPELNGIGWVSSEFVTITQEITVIPTLGSAIVNTSDGARLRVRDIPSVDGTLRDFLFEGETYEVVATTEDGTWALLNLANETGAPIPGPSWVATEFITITGPDVLE